MAVLPLIIAPDPRLKEASDTVTVVDERVRKICKDMLETMYANHGIGLAAVQVGIMKRIIVIDISNAAARYATDGDDSEYREAKPMCFINPEIIEESDDIIQFNEGCLSFPDHYSEVERPAEVTVRYLNERGENKTLRAKGLLSICLQHEIDHTNGVVFVDHISKLKRDMIMKKLTKAKKLGTVTIEETPVTK